MSATRVGPTAAQRRAKEHPIAHFIGVLLAAFLVFALVHWVASGPTWAGLGFGLVTYYVAGKE